MIYLLLLFILGHIRQEATMLLLLKQNLVGFSLTTMLLR